MKIYKSLKWGMVQAGDTILEKSQLLKDLGYDGVELDSPNDLDNDKVLEARDKTGLKIPGVVNSYHWKYPLSDPDPDVRKKDRKSTRLNSSHVANSYAVFCLINKKR